MKLCDGENDILGALQMEKNTIKYFELINEKFPYLYELYKKVGLSLFIVESEIGLHDDMDKINQIHK